MPPGSTGTISHVISNPSTRPVWWPFHGQRNRTREVPRIPTATNNYAVAMTSTQRVGIAGLLVTLAIVFAITLDPTPVDHGHRAWATRTLSAFHQVGVPHTFGYAHLEFTANIIMFIPLGVFLTLALKRQHR